MINRIINQPPIPLSSEYSASKPEQQDLNLKRQQSFAELLQGHLKPTELSFSAHAMNRLEQRNIQLNQTEKDKLEDAVNKIAQKGGKESLIVMDNMAFVVNIPNRTVITAMDQSSVKDNIYTQIDSAMIINQ